MDNTAADLQAALRAGGIAGPYVLVGHSLGAYESLLLADREPGNVVGMVLVDPSIPDQSAQLKRVAPAIYGWSQAHPDPVVPFLERCVAALRAGTVRRDGPDPDGCLRTPPYPPTYPRQLRAARDKLYADASPQTIASFMEDYISLEKSFDQDADLAIKPDRNYGSLPLIILTAGEFQAPPEYSPAAKVEMPLWRAEWRHAHDSYAALSSHGVNRTVVGSSHFIQLIKPQAVTDAIDEVLSEARQAPSVSANGPTARR